MRFSILGSSTGGGDPINFSETGRMSINGNFHHQPGSVLELQVAGTNNTDQANYQFDQLVIDGTMTNGGALVVELLPSYVPEDGDIITLVQSSGSGWAIFPMSPFWGRPLILKRTCKSVMAMLC